MIYEVLVLWITFVAIVLVYDWYSDCDYDLPVKEVRFDFKKMRFVEVEKNEEK